MCVGRGHWVPARGLDLFLRHLEAANMRIQSSALTIRMVKDCFSTHESHAGYNLCRTAKKKNHIGEWRLPFALCLGIHGRC